MFDPVTRPNAAKEGRYILPPPGSSTTSRPNLASGPRRGGEMKELKEETSTQKLYWDSENEIVWGDLFGDQKTEEHAKENVDAQERIRDSLNKEKTRVLIDMTTVTEITKEARDYFANERTGSIQRAAALLIGSPVSRVIGNFFMGLNKPSYPTRLFTDPQKAIKWLQTFSND